jgi:CDP-paratose 2-epimerase
MRADAVTPRRVLVTGGAGFVGGNLAVALAAQHPDWDIVALDSLHRRGSDLNLPRLAEAGVRFVRGDVREPDDLLAQAPVDCIVECSAEPSVLAGTTGSPDFLIQTNLLGAYNCLELARRTGAHLVFLSTSRVYPIDLLDGMSFVETESRFELAEQQVLSGTSLRGVAEDAPLHGARTLYGTTKLAAEQLIVEYAATYGVSAVIDRCGVIAGPWQMGKVDQGVFTYWVLAHHFGWELAYIGYGGSGKQVRDVLHVDDLVELVSDQVVRPEHWEGQTVNVGGGREHSLSLRETSEICAELTGRRLTIGAVSKNRPGDVRIYLSDYARLSSLTDWRPKRGPRQTLEDILTWVRANEAAVASALG